MRALVTGATGFIGRHLVLELRRRGWDVVCAVRTCVNPSDPGIQCIHADLLHPSSFQLDDIAGSIDTLFHFAAQLPSKDIPAAQYLTANCLATARLLETSARSSIKSVVYASSLPVIGKPEQIPITEDHSTRPRHPYHLSKLCGEMACEMERRVTGRMITTLRITSPYGPGMSSSVLARFVDRALSSEDVQWIASGSRAQNFVHVSDVVNATLLAAEKRTPGVYNVGGAETITMQDLARLVVRLAAGSGSKASSADGLDPEEEYRWEVDLGRSESCLGYRPKISLEQGLLDYIAWAKSKADAPSWWKA